jgi:membrane protease YdiL (CAAX protease family)
MWCPAAGAIITRLWYQKNLAGFGVVLGGSRWLLLGFLLPVAMGLFMSGTAWLTGIGPFDGMNAAAMFSFAFIPSFAFTLLYSMITACGEELGWRGFLVPELAEIMGFTGLALLSGGIWAAWHIPLVLFAGYHGAGPAWFSVLVFVPEVIALGLILAWLRLRSGSVIPAILFHGSWNYFIQGFYPALTVQTPLGTMVLGEFGVFAVPVCATVAAVFWLNRKALPTPPTGA